MSLISPKFRNHVFDIDFALINPVALDELTRPKTSYLQRLYRLGRAKSSKIASQCLLKRR